MHRRSLVIIALVAVLAAVGATVGLVQAQAQGEPDLAALTPAQLLANIQQHATETAATKAGSVSGAVTWRNDLVGLSALSSLSGQSSGDLTALLTAGSGRLWVQDGKVRFEIQGTGGDTTVVGDPAGVWVYDSAQNTATEYVLPTETSARTPDSGAPEDDGRVSPVASADPVAAIDDFLQKLAPDANVTVSELATIAGRDCYLLSLVPTAANTVFGSVQVSVDGATYLPLKIEVYAKGGQEPVLSAGFTKVSYSRVADDLFVFTPPATATVEHKTLTLPVESATRGADVDGAGSEAGTGSEAATDSEQTPLTLAEAAAEAGFSPFTVQAADPALAFTGAFVIPAHQVDLQLLVSCLQSAEPGSGSGSTSGSGSASGSGSGSSSLPSGPVTLGPTVIQLYGRGFGTVALLQTKAPGALADGSGAPEQTMAGLSLLSKTSVGGLTVYELNTALGSLAVWEKDGFVLAAAGSVSAPDLEGFIAGVR